MKPLKIALITFSDPRYTDDPDEREEFTRLSHDQLKGFIDSDGFQSIDPHAEVERKNSYNFGFDEKCCLEPLLPDPGRLCF